MSEFTADPYASPAPVFTVAGRTEDGLGRDLLRLDVREGVLGLRTMVAHFAATPPDSDGSSAQLSYLDGQVLDLGSALGVALGPPDGERTIFTGTVSALEICFEEAGEQPYVSVFAEDALMRLRMTTRTATYPDSTDAAVVEAVTGEHGLKAQTDADGPTYPVIQQWEQSDLAFLRDRAWRIGAELWADSHDVVHLATRERRPGPELTLVRGQLVALTVRADLAHQRPTVELRGWDHDAARAVSHVSDGAVVAAEVTSGRSGVDVVSKVFTKASLSRSRRDVLDQDTADAYADAEMLRRARAFVTADGTTAGTPDLVPGAKLELQDVGRPFEGAGYRVVHAHHSYDRIAGYRTCFRAERPALAS
jgi:phage protein D